MYPKNEETMRIFINKQNNSTNIIINSWSSCISPRISKEKGFRSFFLSPRSWYKLVSRNSRELIPL